MKKRITAVILVFLIITSNTVFASSRIKAKDFKKRTLIIGSHAIDLEALNKELVSIAEKSKSFKINDEIKEQNKVYYKSEFADNTWFDISSLNKLSDIINNQNLAVKNEVIDSLYISHYTNEAGKTISFGSKKAVSVHTIDTIQDPNNMPETEAIKIEQRTINSKYSKIDDLEDDEQDLLKLEKHYVDASFSYLENKKINELLFILGKFDDFEKHLKSSKKDKEEIKFANIAKISFKAEYKIACYNLYIARLNDFMTKLDTNKNSSLISKFSNAINQSLSAIRNLESEIININSSEVLEILKNDYFKKLSIFVSKSDFKNSESYLEKILSIKRIKNKKIIDKGLELLEINIAIDRLSSIILKKAKITDTDEYKLAINQNSPSLVLKKISKSELQKLSANLKELEFLIDAKAERTGKEEKENTLNKTIKSISDAKKHLKKKDHFYFEYKTKLDEFIEKCLNSLSELIAKDMSDINSIKNSITLKENKINNLNSTYLAAIDKNDIALSQKIESAKLKLESDINSIKEAAKNSLKAELDSSLSLKGTSNDKLLENKAKIAAFKEIISKLDRERLGDLERYSKELYDKLSDGKISEINTARENFDNAAANAKNIASQKYIDKKLEKANEVFKEKYLSLLSSQQIREASQLSKAFGYELTEREKTEIENNIIVNKNGDKLLESLLAKSNLNKSNEESIDELKKEIEKTSNELKKINEEIKKESQNQEDKTKHKEEDIDKLKEKDKDKDKDKDKTKDTDFSSNKETDKIKKLNSLKEKSKALLLLYENSIKKLQVLEKQKIIIEILLIKDMLNSEYKNDKNLISSLDELLASIKEIDQNKYLKEDLSKLENKIINLKKIENHKLINPVNFIIDTHNISFMMPVIVLENIEYIPIREFSESFDAKVIWDNDLKMAEIIKSGKTLSIFARSNKFTDGIEQKEFRNNFYLIYDKLYIPLSFLKDYFDKDFTKIADSSILYDKKLNEIKDRILRGE